MFFLGACEDAGMNDLDVPSREETYDVSLRTCKYGIREFGLRRMMSDLNARSTELEDIAAAYARDFEQYTEAARAGCLAGLKAGAEDPDD